MPDISQILNQPSKSVKAKTMKSKPDVRPVSPIKGDIRSSSESSVAARKRNQRRPGRGNAGLSPLMILREKLLWGKRQCYEAIYETIKEQRLGNWLIDSAARGSNNLKGILKLWR